MKYALLLSIVFLNSTLLLGQAGSLDLSFNGTGYVISSFDEGNINGGSILLQTDGKILSYGTINMDATKRDFIITRYLSDGNLDLSFNNTGKRIIDFFGEDDYCNDITLQEDGKILLTGRTFTETFSKKTVLVRLNPDGSFDETFGNNGVVISNFENLGEEGAAIMTQPDNKILVSGKVLTNSFSTQCIITRYNVDGTLDVTFGSGGIVFANIHEGYQPQFGELQEDGKILTGGYLLTDNTDIILLRFNIDGLLDDSFGTQGIVQTDFNNEEEFAYSMAIQSDNKTLLVVGVTNATGRDFEMVRYNNDGSLDDTFGVNGRVVTDFNQTSNTAHDIKIQEDGKILLAGFLGITPNHDFALARYNIDGILDADFGTNGKVTTDLGHDDTSFSMAIQADKKIILSGRVIDNTGSGHIAMARYFSGLEVVKTTVTFLKDELLSIYPNPTTQEAILAYSLKKEEVISINLYNLEGKKVASFLDTKKRKEGLHEEVIHFDTRFPAGNYTLVISNGKSSSSVNIILN